MKIRNAFVPAQLDSLACIDSRQIEMKMITIIIPIRFSAVVGIR